MWIDQDIKKRRSFTKDVIEPIKDGIKYDKKYNFALTGCDDGKNCERDVEDL